MAKTRPDDKTGKTTKPSAPVKPSVNVATLFDKVGKQDAAAVSHRHKAPHPDYLAFLDTTSAYRANATASLAADLETERAILENRIYGLDPNGVPLDLPNLVTPADLAELKAQAAVLNTPFASLSIPVTRMNAKGKPVVIYHTLNDTMEEFTRRSSVLETKIEGLIGQLEGVEGEIQAVMAALRDGGSGSAAFERELEGLKAEADEALKATAKDINDARREDRDVGLEWSAKLEGFLKSLG